MFRVAIFIWPDGDVNSILQHDQRPGAELAAMAFYSRIENEIENFKKRIHKNLSAQQGMNQGEDINK